MASLEIQDLQLSDAGFESIAKLPGLGILNVRGSDVSPHSMRLLSKLPLSLLELDVGRLSPEDLAAMNWATELSIHYDAKSTDVRRIKEHIEALSLVRPNDVATVIRNVPLTTENIEDLLAALSTAAAWKFELAGAVDAEGRSRSFHNVRAELTAELSSVESPE